MFWSLLKLFFFLNDVDIVSQHVHQPRMCSARNKNVNSNGPGIFEWVCDTPYTSWFVYLCVCISSMVLSRWCWHPSHESQSTCSTYNIIFICGPYFLTSSVGHSGLQHCNLAIQMPWSQLAMFLHVWSYWKVSGVFTPCHYCSFWLCSGIHSAVIWEQ